MIVPSWCNDFIDFKVEAIRQESLVVLLALSTGCKQAQQNVFMDHFMNVDISNTIIQVPLSYVEIYD